jgi:hypothetical protein
MKKTLVLIFLIWSFLFSAQESKSLYAKGNLIFAPIGVLNAGLEYQISPKYTIQGDFLLSPWKSFADNHAQIFMINIDGRYYFSEAFKKWYLGLNTGTAVFDITKWNYSGTYKFQRGFNIMFGATIGYQLQIKEKWNLDFYLSGGSVQSFYHGYENIPEGRVRYDDAEKWNKSGEFLPYRGGIMLSYKLK